MINIIIGLMDTTSIGKFLLINTNDSNKKFSDSKVLKIIAIIKAVIGLILVIILSIIYINIISTELKNIFNDEYTKKNLIIIKNNLTKESTIGKIKALIFFNENYYKSTKSYYFESDIYFYRGMNPKSMKELYKNYDCSSISLSKLLDDNKNKLSSNGLILNTEFTKIFNTNTILLHKNYANLAINEIIEGMYVKTSHPKFNIFAHSMGGCVACIMFIIMPFLIKINDPEEIDKDKIKILLDNIKLRGNTPYYKQKITTFGSPKFANSKGIKLLNSLVNNKNYYHSDDIFSINSTTFNNGFSKQKSKYIMSYNKGGHKFARYLSSYCLKHGTYYEYY